MNPTVVSNTFGAADVGAHLGILLVSLAGFLSLAFATERHGEHLLGRAPSLTWQRIGRVAGWCLLGLSLAWAIASWGVGVGITLWLGWLSLAALAWVFALPRWPWQPPVRERTARRPKEAADLPEPAVPRGRRWLAFGLMVVTAIIFGSHLAEVGVSALARPDVLHGKVGPWSFTFAEADRGPPELMEMDIPMKEYRLRWCERCNEQIRQVSLKVNRPRSERTTGMAFMDMRWERRVEIPLPSTVTAASELWLTVVGLDGSVHQTSWRMDEVSPATVAWFNQRRQKNAQP